VGLRVGSSREVAWITAATRPGLTITAAVPPVFAAYATVVIPDDDPGVRDRSDTGLLEVLAARTPAQPWWLGYLDTGVADLVFPEAAKVTLYTGWTYVLIQAGLAEAAEWRRGSATTPWHTALPELLFPEDRSCLVSTLWDDDWRCVGATSALVDALLQHPAVDARVVTVDADATPPGHTAR
jgi:hypothetical protein